MDPEKEKKNIFDKIIDAVSDRDEKAEAAAKAAAEKAAAEKAAAEAKAAAEKAAAEAKAAADKAAADKAAQAKADVEKAAADAKAFVAKAEAYKKAAAEKATAETAAAVPAAVKETVTDTTASAAAAVAAIAYKKGVVEVRSLRIRSNHTTDSSLVGGLVNGDEVTIYETWTDGKDIWARVGPDQWAAMVYNGETYIKIK